METFTVISQGFVLICLGALGGKLGLKYLLFTIDALLMFGIMIGACVEFTPPVARLFQTWLVQSVSRPLIVIGIVAFTLFCGVKVSKWIEKLLDGITPPANIFLGAGFACTAGLIGVFIFF